VNLNQFSLIVMPHAYPKQIIEPDILQKEPEHLTTCLSMFVAIVMPAEATRESGTDCCDVHTQTYSHHLKRLKNLTNTKYTETEILGIDLITKNENLELNSIGMQTSPNLDLSETNSLSQKSPDKLSHENDQIRKNREEILRIKTEMKKFSESREALSTSPTKGFDSVRNYNTTGSATNRVHNRSRSRILRSKLSNGEDSQANFTTRFQDISTNKFSKDPEDDSRYDRGNDANYATHPTKPSRVKTSGHDTQVPIDPKPTRVKTWDYNTEVSEEPKPPSLSASFNKNVKTGSPDKKKCKTTDIHIQEYRTTPIEKKYLELNQTTILEDPE
jgi:hypothetical protein